MTLIWYAFIIGLAGGSIAGACVLRAFQLSSEIRAFDRAIDLWDDDISCYGFYDRKRRR